MKLLLNKIRRTGFLILVGVILIVYFGVGFLFFQQSASQQKITAQITNLQTVLNRPLGSMDKLTADYKQVTTSLAVIPPEEILKKLLLLAQASGINIEPSASKFTFPSASEPKTVKVNANNYQVISFTGITVEGEYSKVMDFVTHLDSGVVLPTLVLTKVTITDVTPATEVIPPTTAPVTDVVPVVDKTSPNYKEYQVVLAAVAAMMKENQLSSIPKPAFPYFQGRATNDMSVFPDISSGWAGIYLSKVSDPQGNNYVTGNKPRTDGVDYWVQGDQLVTEGNALIAEAGTLTANGDRLWAKGDTVWKNGYDLWTQGNTLKTDESKSLIAQGDNLMAEGHTLMAEGSRRRLEGSNLNKIGNDDITEGKGLWALGETLWAESTIGWEEGDKSGYLLYQDDVKADNKQNDLVNYIPTKTTTYYYTLEEKGTLRQFDGPDVKTANEFDYSEKPQVREPVIPEVQREPVVKAFLNVDLYSLTPEKASQTK